MLHCGIAALRDCCAAGLLRCRKTEGRGASECYGTEGHRGGRARAHRCAAGSGFRVGGKCAPSSGVVAGLHPVLQNENGGYLIDQELAFLTGSASLPFAAAGVQKTVSFDRGEAFVDKVYGQAAASGEIRGEGLNLCGPRTGFTVHVQRIADHNFSDGLTATEAEEVAHVFAGALSPKRKKGLGGVAEGIGKGDADADLADVEGKDAGREAGLGQG